MEHTPDFPKDSSTYRQIVKQVLKSQIQHLVREAKLRPEFLNFLENRKKIKGGRALRGYFGPPMRSKNKNCSAQVSSYKFIRTIAKVYRSGIYSTFSVAMVTKMAAQIG